MKKIVLILFMLLVVQLPEVLAQCAMCRSTLENNYSNGNAGIAAGFNSGILYLLVMPYLAAMLLGYFWYRSSKNASKEFTGRAA